jgi:hypothetical protein
MATVSMRGKETNKPRGTQEYNLNMGGGGVYLKDQKRPQYETEMKRRKNWYTEPFKRLTSI